MSSIKISALAFVLGIIMLVSAASASYDISIPGGSESSSANGGTSGTWNSIKYQDDGSGSTSELPGSFDYILKESAGVWAHINSGQTGTASAGYKTNGAKTATQTIDSEESLTTTLNGQVGVQLSKTSTDGAAEAAAGMKAVSALDDSDKIGGKARLFARIEHSGLGDGSAFVTGGEASWLTLNEDDYSKGYAKGDINIQGANLEQGGSFGGYGEISAASWVSPETVGWGPLVGQSELNEYLSVEALRDVSFPGDSQVVGVLENGMEMGESVNNDLLLMDGEGSYSGRQIVDAEATSVMSAEAKAFNARDYASSTLDMEIETTLEQNRVTFKEKDDKGKDKDVTLTFYDAEAESFLDAYATAERHVTESPNKAESEGYITAATWTATAQGRDFRAENKEYDVKESKQYWVGENLASITGALGGVPDGKPSDLPGFGVGAWIQHPFGKPVTAEITYEQEATTRPEEIGKAKDDEVPVYEPVLQTSFVMQLNGMRATDNTVTNDAVGAYGAVKDQFMSVEIPTEIETKDAPDVYSLNALMLEGKDIQAINWLEGKNPDFLPGWYKPSTMVPSIYIDAASRNVGLTYSENKDYA